MANGNLAYKDSANQDNSAGPGQHGPAEGQTAKPAGQLDYSIVHGTPNSDTRPHAERQAEYAAEQEAKRQAAQQEESAQAATGELQAGEFDSMSDVDLEIAMGDEISLLQDIDPDGDFDFDEVSVPLVEATKTLRLIGQGDIEQASQLLIRSAKASARLPGMDAQVSAERVSALETYVSTVTPGDDGAIDFLCELAKKIFKIRNDYANEGLA